MSDFSRNFERVADSVVPLVSSLLGEAGTEQLVSASDRVGGMVTTNASSTTQATTAQQTGFDPAKQLGDTFLSNAMQPNLVASNTQKFVELGATEWSISQADSTNLLGLPLPTVFFREGMPARGPTRPFRCLRANFNFELQVNAVTGCSGALMMYYAPPGVTLTTRDWRTMKNHPYALVNIGTDTTGKLYVPYTAFENYADIDDQSLGSLHVFIWSKLEVPDDTSNAVSVVVYGSMDDLDLQVVRPQMNGAVTIREGPGIMNLADASRNKPNQKFALWGEKVRVDTKTAGSVRPIRDFLRVPKTVFSVCKDFNYTIPWTHADEKDKVLYQSNLTFEGLTPVTEMLANAYKFWRGSIVLQVTVFCSPFHKGRLRICWFPVTDEDGLPTFSAIKSMNSIYTLMDIGLNPSIQMTIPFMSKKWLKATKPKFGRLQIFVASRLCTSANSAGIVRVMVEAKPGKDCEMFCPRDGGINYQGDSEWETDDESEVTSDTTVVGTTDQVATAAGVTATENVNEKREDVFQPRQVTTIVKTVKVPKATHTRVTATLGRATEHAYITLNNIVKTQLTVPTSGPWSLLKMYAYWTGPFTVHIMNISNDAVGVAHSYDDHGQSTSMALMSSDGTVWIPPKQMASIEVPFYNESPLRPIEGTGSDHGFGFLYIKSDTEGSVRVLISAPNISLFQPIATPLKATLRSYLASDRSTENEEKPSDSLVKRLIEDGHDLDELIINHPVKHIQSSKWNRMLLKHRGREVRDLTVDGDVESNPGPMFLVERENRSAWTGREFGIKLGNSVMYCIHEEVTSFNICNLKLEDCGTEWEIVSAYDLDQLLAVTPPTAPAVFRDQVQLTTDYSEGMVEHVLGQGDESILPHVVYVLLCCIGNIHTQGDPKTATCGGLGGLAEAGKRMWGNVSGFFSEQLLTGIKSEVTKTVIRAICKTVCYGVLFFSNPGLLTGACVATLIAIDVATMADMGSNVKTLCSALLDGDLVAVAINLTEMIQEHQEPELTAATVGELKNLVRNFPKKQGPLTDFNIASLAAKNLEWWLKNLQVLWNWFKKFFHQDEMSLAQKYFEQHENEVTQILLNGDDLLNSSKDFTAVRSKEYQDMKKDIMKKLSILKQLAMRAHSTPFLMQTSTMLNRLQNVATPVVNDGDCYRVEPVGVWVSGSPGCGKSAFAMELATGVKRELTKAGMNQTGTFTSSGATEHMDGYNNQLVHVIDDFGQNREEEDFKFICQMISSVPFVPPMAALEEKGMVYSSKLLIATTNRHDFASCKLWDSKALERRFVVKVGVKPNPNYEKDGKLNLIKATEAQALSTGAAWLVNRRFSPGQDKVYYPCDMNALIKEVSAEIIKRVEIAQQLNQKYAECDMPKYHRTQALDWSAVLNDLRAPNIVMQGNKTETKDEKLLCHFTEQELLEMRLKCERDLAAYNAQQLIDKLICDNVTLGFDSPFESLNTPMMPGREKLSVTDKIRNWYKDSVKSAKNWLSKNKVWISAVSVLCTLVSTIIGMYTFYKSATRNRVEVDDNILGCDTVPESRAYNPFAKPKKVERKIVHQGNPLEVTPLRKYSVSLQDPYGSNVQSFAVSNDTVITYKHTLAHGGYGITDIEWNGLKHRPEGKFTITELMVKVNRAGVDQVLPSDMITIKFDNLPWQLPSGTKVLGKPEVGKEVVLLQHKGLDTFAIKYKDLAIETAYNLYNQDGDSEISVKGLRYCGETWNGLCGAFVCQKQRGTYKVIGMHHAGDEYVFGYGLNFHFMGFQGIVVNREPAQPRFMPSKTALKKSPLHNIFPVTYGPAPLHPKDSRLEIDVDSLIKHAAEKYRVNVFEPYEEAFEEALGVTTKTFYEICGINGTWSMEEALEANGNHLDLSTSPGEKYVKMGYTKRDLIWKEGDNWKIHDLLRNDVNKIIVDLERGVEPKTTFSASLKDELRPLDKVKIGKTRCIECSSVDFTIAYRMYVGKIYDKIYNSTAMATGVAVGINPYTDFAALNSALSSSVIAIDFGRFDGSLSDKLMSKAVEVLAACSEHPDVIRLLHNPVIYSKHHVGNELWSVYGGMPSGSPCTSVLNSICNLLVCRSIYYHMTGLDLERWAIATYGDDMIADCQVEVDGREFCGLVKAWFGMEATSADKKGFNIVVPKSEATFLKRKFKFFPGTLYVTGALDLESMKQHIMWTRGEFKEQFDTFLFELVLHGPDVYNEVTAEMRGQLDKYKIYVPSFQWMRARVYRSFFQ